MNITTKRGDKVRFNDIQPGDVFQTEYRDTYIKVGEAIIVLEDGTTSKANALSLETGILAVFEDYDTIYKVEAELVIL